MPIAQEDQLVGADVEVKSHRLFWNACAVISSFGPIFAAIVIVRQKAVAGIADNVIFACALGLSVGLSALVALLRRLRG